MHWDYNAGVASLLDTTTANGVVGMNSAGLIGAGVSSLHLGFRLLEAGFAVTLYAQRRPEDIENARLQNSVSHQYDTVQREQALGIDFWNETNCRVALGHNHWLQAPGMAPLEFWGSFEGYGKCVDYRMYIPRLMRELEARGGRIEYRDVGAADIDTLASEHDVLAVGVGKGKGGLADFFPRQDELSRHREPARLICCGVYEGVRDTDPLGVTISISAGHGELIVLPIQNQTGPATALLFENRKGGDLEDLMTLDYEADPGAFHARILDALEQHHGSTYRRVDHERFRLARPRDLLQGCFTPVTRRPWAELGDGRYLLATGDLRCTMDPVTGQGANLASYGAWVLADHLIEGGGRVDEAFCRDYEAAVAYRVAGTVNLNNAILDPEPHLPQLLGAMSQNPTMADDFTARFARPETLWWEVLKDADTCATYMARFEPPAAQAAAH